jgi:formylglycine-generating enzyme required for sulfatase activity/energy-coupling factor transporter ATP-binding protein EcfA2
MTDSSINLNANENITIGGDVVGRDKITNVTVTINMPGFTPPRDLEKLRADYLDHLRRSYRALDLKLPQLENFTRELLLEDVYVPLLARPELPAGETWERRLAGRAFGKEALPEEIAGMGVEALAGSAAPVQVEQALAEKPRVVVIGDPGSGKTTLLKHLALRLASEPNAPLPILVPLNAYADALSRADRNLQQYLPEYFAGRAQGVADLAPLFDSAIQQGQAVILLDGLDEVQKDPGHLVEKVEAFAREAVAHGNKLVVTSRVVGYRESPLDPKAWALYTLLDFDRAAIEQFAAKWCLAFEISAVGDTPEARAAAEAERRSLLEAIDANPGVERLASNPLLLTLLALIKRQGVSLPNRRVELYELYLRTLISAWSKSRALDKRPVGPALDYLQTVRVLGPLALWLREKNPTAGLIAEEPLMEWLSDYFAGDEWRLPRGQAAERARDFLESVRKYSNLLLERGQGRYGFIHLTFEEMLAARGLVRLGQVNFEDGLALIRRHFTDPGWRETILLTVGVWWLVREDPERAGEIARAILRMECSGDDAGKNVLLAGACLEDVGEQGLTRAAAQEITAALLAACRNRSLPPTVQRDAGFILGRTGWVPDDLDLFIPIPAGPFLYGDDKRKAVIDQPFAISKYPITNYQFRRFIEEAKGYDRREFWSEEGWAWRIGTYDSKAPKEYQSWLAGRPPERRGEPFFWHDPRWKNPLAPVVGVSWFEAEAYSNWLSQKLGKPIRLPTEEEWERAARHTDGREYPWGSKFDHRRLNCAEFWGGQDDLDWNKWYEEKGYETASTTIVGQFAEGNSEAGLSDMSGNVWEWTNSWYDAQKMYRIVRGGSWGSDGTYARGASRDRLVPGSFSDALGLRVASPGSHISAS